MLGGEHASSQITRPERRAALISAKLHACAGPDGATADRDRRILERFMAYARAHGIPRVWPITSAAIQDFACSQVAASRGPAGGSSVDPSIKGAFTHMHTHLSLPIEIHAGILFNCAPVCARQPRPAASTSIFIACFWEHHAMHAPNPHLRELCRYQVIAILTTLRFKELKRARVTSLSQLSLMVSLTKDGSHDMWVGAPLEGFLGHNGEVG
jgi:hypothetical protein